MAGAEIKDVNASREVNRRINSNDSNADFQAQLKEIDKELNKFDSVEGIVEVGPVSMQGLGVDGLGLTSQQVAFDGPFTSKNDQEGREGSEGTRWAQRIINKGSCGMINEPMSLKRNLCESLEEEDHADQTSLGTGGEEER
nr:hypothetical protein CFP56_28400 [Quercus suber]